jgi:hypothetical protein
MGDEVVAGLMAYKQDHGTYPATLEELVPQYLPAVPKPPLGQQKWEYELTPDNAELFNLHVLRTSARSGAFFGYDITTGKWYYVD